MSIQATNIHPLDTELLSDVFVELNNEYLTKGLNTESKFVRSLNYCGFIVQLEYFLQNNCKAIGKLSETIPWLSQRIIFYETDPNLKISEAVGDDRDYGAEYLDKYSVHLHRVENAIAVNNTNATLNFPLLNCNEQSVTTWYKMTKGTAVDMGYLSRTDECNVEIIQETSLYDGQCSLMRLDRWHSVKNNSGKRRVIANWDFKYFVPWDDAVDILV